MIDSLNNKCLSRDEHFLCIEIEIYHHHKINFYVHKLREKNEKYSTNQTSSSQLYIL